MIETKVFARFDEDDYRFHRRKMSEAVGGLERLGTIPDGFPLTKEEAAIVDPYEQAGAVGQRIINRLTNRDWVDEPFLLVGRAWAVSVQDGVRARDYAWWRATVDGRDADRVASDLAANDVANAERVQYLVDAIDEMLHGLRSAQAGF